MKRALIFGFLVTSCGFVVDVPEHPVVPHLLADGTCELGFGDCDQNLDNGCETDLSRDDTCGACDVSCSLTKCVTLSASPPSWACDPTQVFAYPDNAEAAPIPFTIQGDDIFLIDDLGRTILTTTISGGDATMAPLSSQFTLSPLDAIASTPSWLFWGAVDESAPANTSFASVWSASLSDMAPIRLWQGSAPYQIVAQLAVNGDAVFWNVVTYNSSYTEIDQVDIWSASLASLPTSPPSKIYSSPNSLNALSPTSQHLYWQEFVQFDSGGYDFLLKSCAPADCAATVVSVSQFVETPVFEVGSNGDVVCVYAFQDGMTGALFCGEDGTTFAPIATYPFPYDAVSVASDGGSFFVADGTGDNLYAVMAGSDCTAVDCARTDTHGLPGFVQTSNGVTYWSSPSGIFRWSHPFSE